MALNYIVEYQVWILGWVPNIFLSMVYILDADLPDPHLNIGKSLAYCVFIVALSGSGRRCCSLRPPVRKARLLVLVRLSLL